MSGETNIKELIRNMTPQPNNGEYVFCCVNNINNISREETLFEFKEAEGTTVVIEREKADNLNLSYDFIASWITLKVHSSLNAVGLTALFSNALAKQNISCNVIAGYYHDHIFVNKTDEDKAMEALKSLSKKEKK